MIKVKILETNTLIEINEEKIGVRELLRKLGLTITEHIVIRNGSIVTEDDVLYSGDEVLVFTVKSGG